MRYRKTKEQRFTFKYRFIDPSDNDVKYGIVIYEHCGMVGALQQFYEKLTGMNRIEILNIESEYLYERVD